MAAGRPTSSAQTTTSARSPSPCCSGAATGRLDSLTRQEEPEYQEGLVFAAGGGLGVEAPARLVYRTAHGVAPGTSSFDSEPMGGAGSRSPSSNRTRQA